MEVSHRKILEECLGKLAKTGFKAKFEKYSRELEAEVEEVSKSHLVVVKPDSDVTCDEDVLQPSLNMVGYTADDVKSGELNMTGVKVDVLIPFLLKYRIFTPDMLKDIKCEIDLFHELPTRGPHAFKKFICVLREAGYGGEAYSLEQREREWCVSPKKTFYEISSRPLGFCLIINNVKFKPPKTRYGSTYDATALSQIFRRMNFTIEPKDDLTAEQMVESLQEFSARDFSEVDCSVVIILSHGARVNDLDVILGVDGKYFYKNIIYELFNYDNHKTLRKKPKIFLFQCCRDEDAKVVNGLIGESLDSVKQDEKDPKWSDMYIAHSCLPNEESIRDFQTGAWFCQDLVEVFSQHYHDCHLDQMIQMVNIKLMQRSSSFQIKQAIHTETFGLRGPIFFNKTIK